MAKLLRPPSPGPPGERTRCRKRQGRSGSWVGSTRQSRLLARAPPLRSAPELFALQQRRWKLSALSWGHPQLRLQLAEDAAGGGGEGRTESGIPGRLGSRVGTQGWFRAAGKPERARKPWEPAAAGAGSPWVAWPAGPAVARTSCPGRLSPAWATGASMGLEVQVLEGGPRFSPLQPERGGESRYISGTGREFTGEDTTSPCYQHGGNIQ